MRLIFIYGLPGTGKLTVAKELATLTGYKLFHNHLTVDLAASLFAHGSAEYMDYVRSLRLEAFKRAAASNVNLIFTFWYSNISMPSVELYREVVESAGGTVDFVHLHCRTEILEQRVTLDSRRGKKIDSVADLRVALLEYGTADTIPGTALEINNSNLKPRVVAEHIAAFFELGLSSTYRP